MTPNEKLLKAIRERGEAKKAPFGEGILTADRYVKTLRECVGSDICYRYAASKDVSFDDVLRKAAQTLVYRNQDMVATDKSDLPDPERFSSSSSISLPEDVEIELPKNTLMVFRHILTTPRKDRDGDVLRTQGAEVDPKMLLLWQHVHTLPVGKMLAKITHNTQKLELVSAIVDMNELCHDAAVMVDNDMARFSHGFRALEFEELKEDEGQTTSPGGFDVKRFEIMEESLVSVPSNKDAETEEVILSLVEGEKLTSGIMREYGRSIRERRPKQFAGVEFTERMGDYERSIKAGDRETFETAYKTTTSKENGDAKRGAGEAEGAGGSCGCGTGGGAGASEQKDGKAEGEGQATQAPEDSEVKGRIQPGSLAGSWEAIEHELHAQAGRFLQGAGVSLSERFVWLVGTFADHAIVCAEHHSPGVQDEFVYYRIAWEIQGREARFVGEVERVEIEFTVEEVQERSPGKPGEKSNDVKAGARLSRANKAKLEDVREDLGEMREKEEGISRASRAMLERDVSKLAEVIGGDEADGETSAEITAKRAIAVVLTRATIEERRELEQSLRQLREREQKQRSRRRLKKLLAKR